VKAANIAFPEFLDGTERPPGEPRRGKTGKPDQTVGRCLPLTALGHRRQTEDAVISHAHRDRRDQQDRGKSAAELPVLQLVDLQDDQLADHGLPRSTEQRRGDEEAKGRDKDQEPRSRHAAQRELIEDLPEGLSAAGPQCRRRHGQAPIDLVHHRKHGDDGERQQRVRHREHDGGAAEQQLVATRHTGGRHDFADDAVSPEQDQPGKILDQRAGPERQQDKQHGDALLPWRLAAQPIGQWIAKREG
jgi:hypothetical protein